MKEKLPRPLKFPGRCLLTQFPIYFLAWNLEDADHRFAISDGRPYPADTQLDLECQQFWQRGSACLRHEREAHDAPARGTVLHLPCSLTEPGHPR